MAASTNDLFKKVGDATVTTLAAPGKALGATSITVGATTNYPTDTGVIIAIRVVDASGTVVAGTYAEYSGTITSGTTIGIVATPVYGSDQVYAAGSTTQVYIGLSKYGYNTLIDGILVSHNQDGTMVASLPLTTPKVATSINDTNGNEVIVTPATASAVNEVTITNSATGSDPRISASGGDSARGLNLRGKGLAKTVNIGAGAVNIFPYDYVASGCVWTADAAGSTRLASMTAGVVVINGNPITVAAVTSRTFTASKDVYVDVLDNGDGTGLLVYTDGTTNAASGALASNSIRLAIIVVGASSIATAASVNQGQEDRVLPIISSVPMAVTDSLGNLICPRDPQRRILGLRRITADFTTASATDVQVTGLSVPVIIPTSRKAKITAFASGAANSTAGAYAISTIYRGTIGGGGVGISAALNLHPTATREVNMTMTAIDSTGGSLTYNVGLSNGSVGTAALRATSPYPACVLVELV